MKKHLLIVGLVLMLSLVIGGVAFAANANFEEKQALVNEKVAAGEMTADEAEEFLAAVQERLASCDGECDGSGPDENRERLGQKYGIGFAYGNGNGSGEGFGAGSGKMNGQNGGFGQGNCLIEE